MTGQSIDSYITNIETLAPVEAATQIIKDEKVFEMIQDDKAAARKIIIDETPDGNVQDVRKR